MAETSYEEHERVTKEKLFTYSTEQFARLNEIWQRLGLSCAHKKKRLDTVFQHTENLYGSMVEDEEHLLRETEENVAQLDLQLLKLSHELGVDTHIPECEGLCLRERLLRQELDKLEEMKRERLVVLHSLLATDRTLCQALEEPAFVIDEDTVPADDDINQLRLHIDEMEKIKLTRQSKFTAMKDKVLGMIDELAFSPDDTFSRDIVFEDADSFKMSKENIDIVEQYLGEIQTMYEKRKREVQELRVKVEELYNRLEINAAEQQTFYATLSGLKEGTVTKLKAELSRLQLLRLQHMEMFVSRIRAELHDWWAKCYYSEQQKAQFTSYTDNDYTEMLLELHEIELNKVKSYYTQNETYLSCVQEWDDLHTQYKYLQQRAKDPNRYKNRGAQLIEEERERKRVEKQLPKLESRIDKMFERYEAEHGQPLLIQGVSFPEFIRLIHQREAEEVARERNERRRMRDQQMEQEMHYGSSGAASSSSKRKHGGGVTTPTASNSSKEAALGKKQRLHQATPQMEATNTLSPFGNRTGGGRSTLNPTPVRPRTRAVAAARLQPRNTLNTGKKLISKPSSVRAAESGLDRRRALAVKSQQQFPAPSGLQRGPRGTLPVYSNVPSAAGGSNMAAPMTRGNVGGARPPPQDDTGIFTHLASYRSDPEFSIASNYSDFTKATHKEAFTSSIMHK